MPPVATRSVHELVGKARSKLGLMQHELARAVGSSVRTVSRWEGGTSGPAPWHLHKLAALVHPLDAALAHDAAHFGGTTLEQLGLVKAPPPAPPPRPAPADSLSSPLPTRVLVDAVLFAAIDALGAAPATCNTVRAALRAAFAHARDLRLDPAQVVEALSPLPPEPPEPERAAGDAEKSSEEARSLRRSPGGRGRKRR